MPTMCFNFKESVKLNLFGWKEIKIQILASLCHYLILSLLLAASSVMVSSSFISYNLKKEILFKITSKGNYQKKAEMKLF